MQPSGTGGGSGAESASVNDSAPERFPRQPPLHVADKPRVKNFQPGEWVATIDGFGAPYLSIQVVYQIRRVESDGCLILWGRMGAWPWMYFVEQEAPERPSVLSS